MNDMHFRCSEWKGTVKRITLISAIVTIISSALTLFVDITIPGLTPIAMGITLLGLSIRELNDFKSQRQVYNLVQGIVFIVLFIFDLYLGITQMQNCIFSL